VSDSWMVVRIGQEEYQDLSAYLDSDLFINALLLLLDLFLEFLQSGSIRSGAIGLEYLNIPSNHQHCT